jgi:hypothetical protein
MFDLTQLDELLSISGAGNTMGYEDRIQAILAVDAIAFKPLITIRENGSVEGTDDFESLESSTCFHSLHLIRVSFRISS